MSYSYSRSASRIPPSLGHRSGYELRVIAALSGIWPFETNDEIDSAARGVDTMKRKCPDLWKGMVETNLAPKEVADIIVSVALKGFKSGSTMGTSYSYDRTASTDPNPEYFRDLVIAAIKQVAAGLRPLGFNQVIKYNPQERIDKDSHGIHGTFFLKFVDSRINSTYNPGINFYWDLSKELGTVGTSNLVGSNKNYYHLPLDKMGDAMLGAAEDIVKDLKKYQLGKSESKEVWSVVTMGEKHGYAADVEVFSSKAKAEQKAKEQGNCYIVKGTQMWNEPLGQVEEHDGSAPRKFFP